MKVGTALLGGFISLWAAGCSEQGASRGTGDPAAGDTAAGDVGPGDMAAGDTETGDSGTGDAFAGDNGAGDGTAGDSSAGDPAMGDADTGDSLTGDAAPPLRAYLDRCDVDGQCASMMCRDDIGGSRFCSQSCVGHGDCADEHICVSGTCLPDDTGASCTMSNECALGLCMGAGIAGAHCTRECNDASDCPSGFACADGGGLFVCINIEVPASACVTGISVAPAGCTSTCRTPADCPARFASLLAYTCENPGGGVVCVPPIDIAGDEPIGATCDPMSVTCRSGFCADGPAGTPVCQQRCAPEGGCGPGLGCYVSGGTVLACGPSGSGSLLSACGAATDCASLLCDGTDGACTRFCSDGYCPTGWACTPEVGGVSPPVCRPE